MVSGCAQTAAIVGKHGLSAATADTVAVAALLGVEDQSAREYIAGCQLALLAEHAWQVMERAL